MKKSTLFILGSITLTTIGLFAFNNKGVVSKYHALEASLNTGGAPSGSTGAPGEATCTACHSGSVQDGNAGVNVLELTAGGNEYTPDDMNSFELTLTDASSKNGFQLVVLNTADEMAGTLQVTDMTNTQFITSAFLNRNYITHTSAGTALDTWEFDWFAPAVGGDVTFYVATNKSNGSGSGGDVIYVSEHNFTAPDLVGIEEEENLSEKLTVGFQPNTSQLLLDFDVLGQNELTLNVTDMSGKSVFFQNMGVYTAGSYSDKVFVNFLDAGIYNVTLFMNNKPFTGKIFVQ